MLLLTCLEGCRKLPLLRLTDNLGLGQADSFALRQFFLDRFGLSCRAIDYAKELYTSGIARE